MERLNIILGVLVVTALSYSPGHGQEVLASVTFPGESQPAQEINSNAFSAPVVFAAGHLRAGTIIRESDIVIEGGAPDAIASLKAIITGKEVKRTIYAGKPFTLSDLGSPTVIKRNAIITIEFSRGPLVITTDGRALDPGGVGDIVRVMNLSSKTIVSATVAGANKVVTQ